MQFGIFIVRQLQEKFYAVNKTLYMAFVDLEKAFDRVPRRFIWWALHKLHVGVDEWLVRLMKGIMKTSPAECVLLLLEPLTVHHGSGSPLPGVSYRMSLGKPVYR